jgi:hypothetical protein
MSTVLMGEVCGAILTMEIDDGTQRITSATLDATQASRDIHFSYDGGKIEAVVPKGQSVTQTFVGANRVERITEVKLRPDGTPVPGCWVSPPWLIEGV